MNLEDIARKAGVSRSTVSRVINDDPKVAPRTRDLVWEVIRQENYLPNVAARALVTRRSEIIGTVIPLDEDIFFADNSYFPMLLEGLSHAMSDAGYGMLLWMGSATRDHLIPKISNHHLVDGVIFVSTPADHPLYDALPRFHHPCVMIDRPVRYEDQINYVSLDNYGAGFAATEYLIRLGRQRVGHLAGAQMIGDGVERLRGYKAALLAADRPVDECLITFGIFNRQSGYQGMKRLLELPKHEIPDAIFAASDSVAIGAYRAIFEAGMRIPEDVAIIGFDDVDIAQEYQPKLTTVRQPVREKGGCAAQLLMELIDNPSQTPRKILLPYELVIRDSCGGKHTM